MSPHIPDKGLISKIYKKLLQHNSQKFRSLYFKYARDLNRVLFTEDILKKESNITTDHQGYENQTHNDISLHTC